MLFAIDHDNEEVIVSESLKGSNKVNFVARISRMDNGNLYKAVELLTSITRDSKFDISLFEMADKVCQMIYDKHIKND
jgi:hypothetical protein